MHIVFFVCALASIAAVVLICLFLFANGIPAMKEIGLLNFLTGAKWKPGNDIYGILPMILGSIYITAGAVVIGVPVGLLTAIFMAFYCPKKLYGLLKPCTELLAGIPSIVYGFFGMVVIVPCIRTVAALFDVDISGSSILAASVLLGIMILPTVIGVSEAALRAVPSAYYEGAVAMGARHERAIFTVMLPAAKSGVLAGVVLGIGHHGRRQPAAPDRQYAQGHPHHDREHRHRDGLRHRPAPRSAHRDRRCAVRVHPHHQSDILDPEKEETGMTREAAGTVSVTRDNARSERVCGGVSAAIEKGLVYAAAILTFAVLLFLIGYILVTGIPHLTPSLFSLHYTSENVSMIPAIVTTVEMTVLALLISVPLGLFTAVYLNGYAKRGNKLVSIIRVTTETLSGIPSVVYGLFGMLFFVTQLHWGYSLIAGAMTLAIMILPLIMRTAEEALMSVPDSFREGSFGLGAGRLRTVFRIVLPAAVPGILSGIILSIGRIVGETAALIFTAGTMAQIPGLTQSGRTLAIHMYVLSGEALHMNEANATAVVLLIVVLLMNALSAFAARKLTKK